MLKLCKKFKLPLLFLLVMGSEAQAVPTLYPQHSSVRLVNSTNSSVVRDSVDANKYYVLPPQSAQMRVSNLHSTTANVGFCRELSEIQQYNRETLFLMNKMKQRQIEIEGDLQKQEARLRHLQIQLPDYVKNLDEYQRRKNEITMLQDDYDRQFARLQELQTNLRKMYQDYLSLYDAHAKREGGRVQVGYASSWTQNLKRLEADNPGLSFEKIQTYNAVVRADSMELPQMSVQGSVISFSVGGQRATGSEIKFSSYPEELSGQAVLNLLAVCPYLHPEIFGLDRLDPRIDVKNMRYALTVAYDFPSEFNYNLTVEYNMYKMYHLITSQGQSGGWFSSHKWSHSDEKRFFQEAFHTEWHWNTDKPWLTDNQMLAIESDIRNQMLSRLAGHLQMRYAPAEQIQLGKQPEAGAIVLSNSLAKTCPHLLVCRAASIGLNVLHSIFSSSRMTQETKQTLNVNMKQTIGQNRIILQPMMTSYR